MLPVTVAEWSEARTVFVRSVAGIVGSNPTQGMDVWCVCVCVCVRVRAFILRLCFPVFRYRPCDGSITRRRWSTDCV
jgi:hypothetical protein